jgi:hypothetical protein
MDSGKFSKPHLVHFLTDGFMDTAVPQLTQKLAFTGKFFPQ